MLRINLLIVVLLGFLVVQIYAQNQAKPKGERLLSIEATEAADKDYDRSFALAREAGMQVTSLSLAWDDLETSPGQYGMEPNFLEIANMFYPSQGVAISLTLAPIDTNNLRLPDDLKEKSVADPEVIERFKRLLDYVFSQIPDLELSSLAIGNEIDAYLSNDKKRWQEYQVFVTEVSEYAKLLHPDLSIGAKVTFFGFETTKELVKEFNAFADVMMLTYYPLNNDFTVRNPNEIMADFDTVVATFPDKPIYILEAGYPSSSLLNSSEEKQAEFIRAVFKAWDKYAEQIKLISFTWLHDISPEDIDSYGNYYGLHDETFLSYLATLGLRTFEGQDKEAFKVLKLEAKQRGW